MSLLAAAPPAMRRHQTRQWLRWWPVLLIALFVLAAVFAPLLAPYDPNSQNLIARLKPPGTTSRSSISDRR